jgi:hypothetical protein
LRRTRAVGVAMHATLVPLSTRCYRLLAHECAVDALRRLLCRRLGAAVHAEEEAPHGRRWEVIGRLGC